MNRTSCGRDVENLLVFFFVLLYLCVPGALAMPGRTDSTFCMCSNPTILNKPEYSEKLLDAGARVCRIDVPFAGVRSSSEADPAKWHWEFFEKVRQLRAVHPQLEWLPILGYGTKWAEDQKFGSARGDDIGSPQRGADVMPASDPANLYGNFVYESVKRNKDIVHCWESWNEPDLPAHAFFKGNGSDFLPYQRACYLAAKQADPTCTVLFAGTTFASVEGYLQAHGLKPPTPFPANSSFFEEYLQACIKDPQAKMHHYYFDVMNQHTYSRATDLFDYVEVDKALMDKYLHEQKPVWITEMGFVDGGPWGGTADEYCDYILQSYAWAKLAGVEKLFHFQLDNSNGHGLYSGLLGAAKPALTTYRDVLTRELKDIQFVAQLHGNKGIGFLEGRSPYNGPAPTGYNSFEFKSAGDNRRIVMLFSDSEKSVAVDVPAQKKSATLIDRHGVRTEIGSEHGVYKLLLPGATNQAGWPLIDNAKARAMGKPEHLVGGATYLIVER